MNYGRLVGWYIEIGGLKVIDKGRSEGERNILLERNFDIDRLIDR